MGCWRCLSTALTAVPFLLWSICICPLLTLQILFTPSLADKIHILFHPHLFDMLWILLHVSGPHGIEYTIIQLKLLSCICLSFGFPQLHCVTDLDGSHASEEKWMTSAHLGATSRPQLLPHLYPTANPSEFLSRDSSGVRVINGKPNVPGAELIVKWKLVFMIIPYVRTPSSAKYNVERGIECPIHRCRFV